MEVLKRLLSRGIYIIRAPGTLSTLSEKGEDIQKYSHLLKYIGTYSKSDLPVSIKWWIHTAYFVVKLDLKQPFTAEGGTGQKCVVNTEKGE